MVQTVAISEFNGSRGYWAIKGEINLASSEMHCTDQMKTRYQGVLD